MLGLSITLAKGQVVGKIPTTTGYATFLGGLGMVASAFGIINIFVDKFGGIIVLAVEGLATLLFIAGGVAMAVMIKGGDCKDFFSAATNKIINCGGTYELNNNWCWWTGLCTLDTFHRETEAPHVGVEKARKVYSRDVRRQPRITD